MPDSAGESPSETQSQIRPHGLVVCVSARNYRKEFFRAALEDVEVAVKRLAPNAPFFKDIEAQDYRETLAKRNAALLAIEVAPENAFPDEV
jgi:hypothetical protein